jgi:hypothetical protein
MTRIPQWLCPSKQALEDGKWIDPARRGKPTELDQIDSSLPIFDLRHPTMGNAKVRGQVALGKPRGASNPAQFRTKSTVFGRVDGFFHCSHYRSVIECSQIRYTEMLTLCQDWRSAMGGVVALDLISQGRGKKLREQAASDLVGATLDVMVAAWPTKHGPPLQVEALSNIIWRISSLYYMYLPVDNDAAFGKCIKLARSSSELIVIVPRRHEWLKRRLLRAALCRRAPNISFYDAFVSWRMSAATIDQGWPPERAVLELVAAYNWRVNSAGRGDSLLVDVSRELA